MTSYRFGYFVSVSMVSLPVQVYIVPEDVKAFHKDKNAKPMKDKDVERVRRFGNNYLKY